MNKKVGLIQVDGTMPNLALMKLSTWHEAKGDKVFLIRTQTISKTLMNFDKVYISCIFEENRTRATELAKQFKDAEVGGVGVGSNTLPDEVEHLMPDYDLYGCDFSFGFTSRGCMRKCEFCKECGARQP